MTIILQTDRIQIGNFSLVETPTGFGIDGYFNATNTPPATGETQGFTSGGGPTRTTAVDKFPFSAPFTTATSGGTLTLARFSAGGHSSVTHGFTSGGDNDPTATDSNVVDRFPFAAPATATDVGDLTAGGQAFAYQSSYTDGYVSGAARLPATPTTVNNIDRFPFAAPFVTATDAGDLVQRRQSGSGTSSDTNGYTSGGFDATPPSVLRNTIDRFPFTAPFVTATDIGDTLANKQRMAGQSSSTNGYGTGGLNPTLTPTNLNTVERFPFSAPFTTATDIGDITAGLYGGSGQSSTTNGYTSGGSTFPAPTGVNTVDRFPFTAPFTTATDVGDLAAAKTYTSGHQD